MYKKIFIVNNIEYKVLKIGYLFVKISKGGTINE